MTDTSPARTNWTPTLLLSPEERTRQELKLLVAQLHNRMVEADGFRDRLQATFDRATALLNASHPQEDL